LRAGSVDFTALPVMPRRFLILFLLAVTGLIRPLCAADSSEQFLSAYQAYQQGEKAERDGSTGEALKNYRYAESLLQAISSRDPSWQKAVVEYRLKKTQEGLSRLQGAGDATLSSAPPSAPAGEAPSQTPQSGPSITITPPGSAATSAKQQATPASSSEVRRLKKLVDSLKSELQSVKDAATAERSRADDLDKMQWTKEKSRLEQQLVEAKDQVASLGEKLHQRDSWEKDLKDLQKRLDDALADKATTEEYYQQREKKLADATAELSKQLEEARGKITAGNESGRKVEELTKQIEQDRESLKQLQAKLDHAGDAAKDGAAKNTELNEKIRSLTAKLSESQKQVEELSPLREKIVLLQQEAQSLKKEADSSKTAIARLDKAAGQREADLTAVSEERAKLASEVQRLGEAVKEAAKVKGLESQSEELRKTVSSLQQQLDAASKEAEHSNALLADSEKDAKAAKQKALSVASAAAADRAVLEEEHKKMELKLAEATQRIEGLGNQLQSLGQSKKEAEDLRANLDENTTALQEVRAKLAETQKQASADQSKSRDEIKGLEASVNSATKEKKAWAADRAVLEEEQKKLETKLVEATRRIDGLGDQVQSLESVKKEALDLQAKLAESTKSLQDADAKIAKIQHDFAVDKDEVARKFAASESLKKLLESQNATLQQQLKDALGQMGALIDKKPETAAMQDQLAKLQQQLADNSKNYADSQKKLAEMASSRPEQEKLLRQREQELATAQSEAKKLKGDLENSNKKITELQQQAQQGQDRMKQLQDQLADLSIKATSGDKASESLQKEVERLKAESVSSKEKLASLKGDSEKAKELQQQLADKESELARLKKKKGIKGSVADAKTADENTVLRGIILKQVKEEAKRAQARRLMEEEMKRLNVQSQTLSDQIGVLSAPSLVLTPEERALFKEGQLVVVDDGSGALQAAVAAPLPTQNPSTETNSSTNAAGPADTSAQSTNKAKTSEESGKEMAWQGKFKECLARAKDEFDRQDYLQAENSFKEALGYSPDDYFALSNLGVVEFQLGKLKEAEEALAKASQKKSDSSFALTTLGIVNYRQERLEEAEKTLRKAIAVNDQDFTAHNYLGIVLAASGKGKAGESEIMKAIEINKNYADAHFNLAVIYATGKPPSKMMAKKHYAKALELGAPPDPSLERLVQ
jgi:chromosome segregation ATPase